MSKDNFIFKNDQESLDSFKRQELQRKVEDSQSYDDLFEVVKRVVESEIGRHRAGLALVLADMPNTVGAFHPVGSNSIFLNRALINALKAVVRNEKEINSFAFMVLMHEYLHSLGYLDELETRRKTLAICKRAFGPDHYTSRMAVGNWLELYPQLAGVMQRGSPSNFERVDRFDSSSMRYIG